MSTRQHGLALAELLVSMALSLAVLLAAATLMASAHAAYLAQAEAAGAHEGARYALDMLARAVRQAGDVNWDEPHAPVPDDAPARIAGLDARTLDKGGAGMDAAAGDALNGSDVLALRFAGSGAAPGGDGSTLNCAGFALHGHEEGWSIFYVGRGAQGEPELRCKYKGKGGWGDDAVIAGVDAFQVLYGLDTDTTPDGVPNRYVQARAIDAIDAALVPAGATAAEREADLRRRTAWKRVASVQLALLLRGARTRTPRRLPHALFGAAYPNDDDPGTLLPAEDLGASEGRERHLFSTTVALRNGVRR